jgi:hypothetical protein
LLQGGAPFIEERRLCCSRFAGHPKTVSGERSRFVFLKFPNKIFAGVGLRFETISRSECQRPSLERREKISLHPIGNEYVRLVGGFAVAIGGPDEALAIGGEHWEGVEIGVVGDLLKAGAIDVDGVEIETAGVFLVGNI